MVKDFFSAFLLPFFNEKELEKRHCKIKKIVIADLCLSFCFLEVYVLVSFPTFPFLLTFCLSALARIKRRTFTHCEFSCGGGAKRRSFSPLAAHCPCCVCVSE